MSSERDQSGVGNDSNTGRFSKGKSGNPNGRPKGSKSLKTILAQELKGPITVTEGGRKKRIRRSEALVKGLVNDAVRGKDRPRETVLRMADAIEQQNEQRGPVGLAQEDQAILDRYVERRNRDARARRLEGQNEAD